MSKNTDILYSFLLIFFLLKQCSTTIGENHIISLFIFVIKILFVLIEVSLNKSCGEDDSIEANNQFLLDSFKCLNCKYFNHSSIYNISVDSRGIFEVSLLSTSQHDLSLHVDFGDENPSYITLLKSTRNQHQSYNISSFSLNNLNSFLHLLPSIETKNHTRLSKASKYTGLSLAPSKKCLFIVKFRHSFVREGVYSLSLRLTELNVSSNVFDSLFHPDKVRVLPRKPSSPPSTSRSRARTLTTRLRLFIRSLYDNIDSSLKSMQSKYHHSNNNVNENSKGSAPNTAATTATTTAAAAAQDDSRSGGMASSCSFMPLNTHAISPPFMLHANSLQAWS